jgi:hypothetical protein
MVDIISHLELSPLSNRYGTMMGLIQVKFVLGMEYLEVNLMTNLECVEAEI